MKTLNILVLVMSLVTSFAALAHARDKGELIASCSVAHDTAGTFIGGISVYQDPNDMHGILRGRMTDNYMSGYLTCKLERDETTIICGGIWDGFSRGTEPVSARLVKTETPGVYSFDLSHRSKFYGGAALREVECRGNN